MHPLGCAAPGLRGITPHNGLPEEAAHHRLRPRRAAARTLLRVAAGKPTVADKRKLEEASSLLKQHHGSEPPKDMAPKKNFWLCHGTDCKGKACGYMVPTGKIACDACGHQPPAHISCPGKAAKGNGKGNGSAGKGGGKGGNRPCSSNTSGSTLEKQLRAELEASKQELAKVKKSAAAEASKAKAASEAAAAPQAVQEAATDEASRLALEVQNEIKDFKGDLHFFASLPEDRRNRLLEKDGGYEKYVAETKEKLEQCYKKQQSSRTLKQQLASAQGREARLEKVSANDESQLATLQEKLAQLQTEITSQQEKATKSKADLDAAKAEVKRLAAATASEGSGPAPHAAAASATMETSQMSVEQLHARSQALQEEMAAFHAEANNRWKEIQEMQASLDADIDIDSDADSVAPSETGGEDCKVKRKMDRARSKKKVAEKFRKATSKFSAPS